MRIAFIGLRGVPAKYSGIERAVEEIGSRLVSKGHEVTVYCMASRYKKGPSSYKGMNLVYIPTVKKKNLEMIIYAFYSAIHSIFKKYDIVHFHAIGPSTMAIFPRIFGKKTVVTVHGLDWQRSKWSKFAKNYLRVGEWTSINFPNSTIVVSRSLKKYYEAKYKKEVVYIPNGIPAIPNIFSNSSEKS